MRSNANENAKKYYYRGKGSIGVNDGRRRRRKIPVPRAAAGYARQLKIEIPILHRLYYIHSESRTQKHNHPASWPT